MTDAERSPSPGPRVALFLQGPPSPFWPELAEALEKRGVVTRRIHLCLADQVFWRRPGAVRYRGRLSGWRRWLSAYLRREGVTDILYYADRLPYHRIAAAVARAQGLRAHAIEFGYLRPDWLTLEREGGGAFSHFPREPATLRSGLNKPDMTPRWVHPFWREAWGEVTFNLIMTIGRPLYPFYADDKYYAPIFDYLAWLAKLVRSRGAAAHAERVQERLLGEKEGYHLLALQLQSDYQLRRSSPYRHQSRTIEDVVRSFAANAPTGHRLLVKLHPLDNGWENWPKVVRQAAERQRVLDRIDVIDGGALGQLVANAAGVIVTNSTVGLHALQALRPVKTLGAAVYDMPGLTHQGPLDSFWATPQEPDRELLRRLLAELADRIQVKGSFYVPEGRRAGAEEMARRIVEGLVGGPPLPEEDVSARTARLRALAARRAEIEGRTNPKTGDPQEEH